MTKEATQNRHMLSEAIALVNGLHFCAEAGVSKVVIKGDAQNVFAALDDTQRTSALMGEF